MRARGALALLALTTGAAFTVLGGAGRRPRVFFLGSEPMDTADTFAPGTLKFGSSIGNPMEKFSKFTSRRKLKVIPGEGSQTIKREEPRHRRRAEEEVLDEVDKVLDKISTHGMASLTPEERKLLDEVSRRYRQN